MTDDQYHALSEIVQKTRDSVNRLETNWEYDRKDFAEFQNRLGHLEVEFKQLRDQILLLPKRTSDRVDGKIGEIKQEAENLKQAIKKSAVVELTKIKKKRWFKFW